MIGGSLELIMNNKMTIVISEEKGPLILLEIIIMYEGDIIILIRILYVAETMGMAMTRIEDHLQE